MDEAVCVDVIGVVVCVFGDVDADVGADDDAEYAVDAGVLMTISLGMLIQFVDVYEDL